MLPVVLPGNYWLCVYGGYVCNSMVPVVFAITVFACYCPNLLKQLIIVLPSTTS